MHPVALGEGKCFAHEAAESLAQGVVPAFDVARFARALAAQAAGAPREHLVVSQPPVAAGRAAAVVGRDALAQSTGTVGRAVPDEVGDHLAGLAAKGDPHPARVCLEANKAPKFVEFEHVAFFGRQKRFVQRRENFGFFSSHLATVCRATPKTRSAARRLKRSTSTARKIVALRSELMAGPLAASTRCAPQALQRYCWVPDPLWPALTRDVLAHVAQQGTEVFTPDFHSKRPAATQTLTTTHHSNHPGFARPLQHRLCR